jgi:hypothetical protein
MTPPNLAEKFRRLFIKHRVLVRNPHSPKARYMCWSRGTSGPIGTIAASTTELATLSASIEQTARCFKALR